MATNPTFTLFPSTVNPPARKSSVRKPVKAAASGPVISVALEVQPAPDHFKHSILCEPPTSPDCNRSSTSVPQRQHARRRLSRPDSLVLRQATNSGEQAAAQEDDRLSPLPTNTHFGPASPHRTRSGRRLRPSTPPDNSAPAAPEAESHASDDDRLSPLPAKTTFADAPRSPPPYPSSSATSSRPTTPPMKRSKSTATNRSAQSKASPETIRSMFPQYDPAKPLTQQDYFPPPQAHAQALASAQVRKMSDSVAPPVLQRFDSGLGYYEVTDQVPLADQKDLVALWQASNGQQPVASKKVRLGLYQPAADHLQLRIGVSQDNALFAMEQKAPSTGEQGRTLTVAKYNPMRSGEMMSAAQVAMSNNQSSTTNSNADSGATIIFPQAAAVKAIESAASSALGLQIAAFDPAAAASEVARLERAAVSGAHRWHACQLRRASRQPDGAGTVTAHYTLDHPTLGTFPVTIAKSIKSQITREVRAKINIHHPTSTPAAIAAETLVLASLDFAHDTFIIDLPAILALDGLYVVDTAVSALLAVTAIENDIIQKDTVTFSPPPKAPIEPAGASGKKGKKKSMKWSRRSTKAIKKVQQDLVGQPADVSPPVQGAIALLGLSLRGAVFVLEAGVNIAAKVLDRATSGYANVR